MEIWHATTVRHLLLLLLTTSGERSSATWPGPEPVARLWSMTLERASSLQHTEQHQRYLSLLRRPTQLPFHHRLSPPHSSFATKLGDRVTTAILASTYAYNNTADGGSWLYSWLGPMMRGSANLLQQNHWQSTLSSCSSTTVTAFCEYYPHITHTLLRSIKACTRWIDEAKRLASL